VRHSLDVRALPPIEPLERVMETLPLLEPGDWLAVRHRQEPYPLYSILRAGEFEWRVRALGVGDFEILIWRLNDQVAERSVESET
jgi:uncharacterized protein (DUF2249 family)